MRKQSALLVATSIALAACMTPLHPATPPLLRDATSTGGTWYVCPAESIGFGARTNISPEFDGRLRQQFPPGTPEADLVSALADQGFEIQPPCKDDPQVRSATFNQEGGGVFFPIYRLPVNATAVWRADDSGAIEWTAGNVAYCCMP